MFGYIYLTNNCINNKKYIGKRKWNDKENILKDKYLGSGKILTQALKKYGRENFSKEILCICDSSDELNDKEKYYIDLYNATSSRDFYNIAKGGNGGCLIEGYSEEKKREIIERTRLKNIGRISPNKGKKRSRLSKEKTSETLKLTWKNIENREKWVQSRIGRVHSEKTKAKMSAKSYTRYGTIPYDNNIVIKRYNKESMLINTFYGIDDYYNYFGTKTCRNLKSAVKNGNLFKNSYWKVISLSTIENTSIGEKP